MKRRFKITRAPDHTGRKITTVSFGRYYSDPTPFVVFLPRYKCAPGKWFWWQARICGRPVVRLFGATFYL